MADIKNISLNGTSYSIKDDNYDTFTYTYDRHEVAAGAAYIASPTNVLPSGKIETGILTLVGLNGCVLTGWQDGVIAVRNTTNNAVNVEPSMIVRIHNQ